MPRGLKNPEVPDVSRHNLPAMIFKSGGRVECHDLISAGTNAFQSLVIVREIVTAVPQRRYRFCHHEVVV